MKKICITLALLALNLIFSTSSVAVTLKIATIAPAGTSWMKEMKKGADAIKKKTSGRVKFKFYPGGVMGNDASVHRKIRINQLQGGAFSSSGLTHIDPSIQLFSLPMIFDSFAEVDHVRKIMDKRVKQHMAENGFILLGITEGGFGRIFSTQPVTNLEQIRATKVWMPEGDSLIKESFDALGVQPIALPLADVFTGLQTGLIETITASSTGAIAFQWHSKVNYMIDTPVLYLIGTLAVSKKAFSKIKPDDQKIVIDEMDQVFERLEKINRQDNINATEALKTQGIKVITPDPEEVKRWKKLSQKSIQKIMDKDGIDKKLVQEMNRLLSEIR
jgi:TRAP-type transport system periplasmic protein